jgi:hypothetical protein
MFFFLYCIFLFENFNCSNRQIQNNEKKIIDSKIEKNEEVVGVVGIDAIMRI